MSDPMEQIAGWVLDMAEATYEAHAGDTPHPTFYCLGYADAARWIDAAKAARAWRRSDLDFEERVTYCEGNHE